MEAESIVTFLLHNGLYLCVCGFAFIYALTGLTTQKKAKLLAALGAALMAVATVAGWVFYRVIFTKIEFDDEPKVLFGVFDFCRGLADAGGLLLIVLAVFAERKGWVNERTARRDDRDDRRDDRDDDRPRRPVRRYE